MSLSSLMTWKQKRFDKNFDFFSYVSFNIL